LLRGGEKATDDSVRYRQPGATAACRRRHRSQGLIGKTVGMLVAVISDTHAPRRWAACPPAVAALLDGVDLILHAGDVCTPDVLDELSAWAPVHAVRGNNDGADVAAWGAPDTLELDLEGVPVAMIHDSGATVGRSDRMARLFPSARLVVFGHSHIPLDEVHARQRLFNPGSPTDRRRQPQGTMGLLTIRAGELLEAKIVPVT
jgi:putative phosphoesterase